MKLLYAVAHGLSISTAPKGRLFCLQPLMRSHTAATVLTSSSQNHGSIDQGGAMAGVLVSNGAGLSGDAGDCATQAAAISKRIVDSGFMVNAGTTPSRRSSFFGSWRPQRRVPNGDQEPVRFA